MFSLSVRIEICCHRRRPVAASTPISPEPEPEVEWDIVEVSSEGSSVAEEEFERRGPTPEELLDTTVRYYAVWKFSSSGASYPGVHLGKERSAYEGLLKLNNGNFGGLKWRRLPCFARARARSRPRQRGTASRQALSTSTPGDGSRGPVRIGDLDKRFLIGLKGL